MIVGPWGGQGGTAFDDGWRNGGVSKLTIYYSANILQGFRVDYGDSSSKLHGASKGDYTEEVYTSLPISLSFSLS